MTTLAETLVPGSIFVVDPAAMMTLLKVTRVVAPLLSATSMVWASTKVPQPLNSLILFFFIRKWIPLVIRSETWRLREKALP